MIVVVLFSVAFAVAIIVSVWRRSARWAIALQKYYIREAQASKWGSSQWEKPWIVVLFRIGIMLCAVVVIAMILALTFGPTNI